MALLILGFMVILAVGTLVTLRRRQGRAVTASLRVATVVLVAVGLAIMTWGFVSS